MHLNLDQRPFATVRPAVDGSGTYRAVSYWQETIDVKPGEPLAGDTQCDVAIIGGGFTGLSTACALKRVAPDLDVVVLEREVIGHGASGRNGGFAMPLLGWDLSQTVRAIGPEKGCAAYDLMYAAVDHLKRVVADEQIDCELESTGYLLLATCASAERHLRAEAELGRSFGYEHRWIDGDELGEYIRCAAFRGGVFDPRPAVIHPAKLVRGLADVARRREVRIYERTPLVELSDGEPVRIRTPHGAVSARAVVLALNGYGASVGLLASRVVPVHTYIVLTEPVSQAGLAEIGWAKRRASLETARNFIHYFRLTADNRILFGGEDAQLFWGGRYQDVHEPSLARLEARFRRYFPSLADVRITHRWGGVLGVTLDMFPTFGAGGDRGNLFHAGGYSGHGVALSNFAGHILTPHILRRLGKAHDGELQRPFFFQRLPPWLPPQPFRYAGLHVYRQILRTQDRLRGA